MAYYSEHFKRTMVKKMMAPNGSSATSLAREVGISQTTLSRWLREYATMESGGTVKQRRPQDWNIRERLEAIIAYEKLDEAGQGEFLRKRGLHEAHLEKWKEELIEGAKESGKRARKSSPEQKRIRELERELHKKDKALAETAALLTLKKKADAIWGDPEDDE